MSEAFLFARVAAFAAVAPTLMRLKLSTLERLLKAPGPGAPPDDERVAAIVRNVDRALSVGRPVIRRGCVTRGLTLYYFLRRAGLDVALCFGMGRPADDYEGHCWLVRDGEPYLERRDPRPIFNETYRIPRPRTAS